MRMLCQPLHYSWEQRRRPAVLEHTEVRCEDVVQRFRLPPPQRLLVDSNVHPLQKSIVP